MRRLALAFLLFLFLCSQALAGGGIGGGPIGTGGTSGGSGTPGGVPGNVQCNVAGVFGACTNITDVVYALPNANTTGNAGTATALAANGANCPAGQAPLGVSASGAAEGCWAVAPAFVSGNQNYVWATPNGVAGLPSLRALVAADIPALNYAPASNIALTALANQAAYTFLGNDTGGAAGPTAIQSTADMFTFLKSADLATARTNLGLGTANTPQFGRIGIGQAADATNPISSSGFSVDPDGDVTAKSINIPSAAATGDSSTLREGTNNGTNFRKRSVPAALTADLDMQDADAVPAANQFQLYPAPTAGVSQYTWTTYGQFGALDLVTTGTIQGGIKISSDADGMTGAEMTAVGLYGTLFIATGAGTWTLPTAVQGMSGCLKDSGSAHDLILDVQAADTFELDGTEGGAGVGVTNASGSSTGDMICFVSHANGHWISMGKQGTWASQ